MWQLDHRILIKGSQSSFIGVIGNFSLTIMNAINNEASSLARGVVDR